MRAILSSVAILVILCGGCLGQDCVRPEPGERTITVKDEFGCGIIQCYNLTRNESAYENYTFYGWILPNLQVLNTTYNDSRIWVSEDIASFTITVTNISRDDVGMYHCMLTRNSDGEIFLLRTGLNIKGPFFVTLWEDYRMNTIVGCSAFGGFVVLMIFVMVMYHFRYQDPDKETQAFDAFGEPVIDDGKRGSPPPYNGSTTTGYVASSDIPPSDGDLRRRSPLTQKKEDNLDAFINDRLGSENKGFVGDDKEPAPLSEKRVEDFFGADSKHDAETTMDTAF